MSSSLRDFYDRLPWFLKPQFLALVFAAALMMLLLVAGLVFLTRNRTTSPAQATAIMNVISAPTETAPAPTQPSGSTPTASVSNEEGNPGEDIIIDAYVQISGTGGSGLRFRTTPSLGGQVKFVASEAEIFVVKDGPVNTDDYIWWYLVGPFDETRNGWAVSNYLLLTQSP